MSKQIQILEKIVEVEFFEKIGVDIDWFFIQLRLKFNDNANQYFVNFSNIQYVVKLFIDRTKQFIKLYINRNTKNIEFLTLKKKGDFHTPLLTTRTPLT